MRLLLGNKRVVRRGRPESGQLSNVRRRGPNMTGSQDDQPGSPESKVIRDFKKALEAQQQKDRREARSIRLLASFVMLSAVVITVYSFAQFYRGLSNRSNPARDLSVRLAPSEERLLILEQNVNKLKQIDRGAIHATKVELSADAALRLAVLEDAVLDNPEKALNLVLVRREVAELRSAIATSETTIQRELSRVYDLTKLAVGAIFGMVLGVLALVLTQLLPKKPIAQVEDQKRGSA